MLAAASVLFIQLAEELESRCWAAVPFGRQFAHFGGISRVCSRVVGPHVTNKRKPWRESPPGGGADEKQQGSDCVTQL